MSLRSRIRLILNACFLGFILVPVFFALLYSSPVFRDFSGYWCRAEDSSGDVLSVPLRSSSGSSCTACYHLFGGRSLIPGCSVGGGGGYFSHWELRGSDASLRVSGRSVSASVSLSDSPTFVAIFRGDYD